MKSCDILFAEGAGLNQPATKMNSAALKDRRLLAFDFDGTLAKTFERSPSGMCVELACKRAITSMFGASGQAAFHQIGGLQNRSPMELIHVIVNHLGPEWSAHSAALCFRRMRGELDSLMPPGKGLPLEWKDAASLNIMAELFVRLKLRLLFKEVGKRFANGDMWPRPMEGLREFFTAASADGNTDIAVLSAGHDQFIRHCFELWGIPTPLVLVTDDDLRPLTRIRPKRRSKPSGFLLWLLLKEWSRQRHGGNGEFRFSRSTFEAAKRQTIYFGDDPVRDGSLAQGNGVPFFLYDPEGKAELVGSSATVFRSWHDITQQFTRTRG